MPIGTVTGTVRLPDGGDGSLSRAWLHFSGTSETSRSNNVLQFTAYDVRAGQHLDLVAMVDVNAHRRCRPHRIGACCGPHHRRREPAGAPMA